MINPKDLLTHFDLSEQEGDIYLALLTLGKSGIAPIAKKIEKNRTAVYFHMNHLVEKGFVKQIKSGKIIKFVAIPPREIADLFERRVTDFKSLIPWMESLKKMETDSPLIDVSETKRGYFKIYDEVSSLPEGSMFRVLEGREAMEGELAMVDQEDLQAFFARVVERKIETKALFTAEGSEILSKNVSKQAHAEMSKRIWHLRLISEQSLPFQNLLVIYGRKASFVFPATALIVTIDHRGIVDALTCMFDGLYQLGRPTEKP